MKKKKLKKHIAKIKLMYDFDNQKAADKLYKILSKGLKKLLEDCDNQDEFEVLRGITLVKTKTTVSVICEGAALMDLLVSMIGDCDDETIIF